MYYAADNFYASPTTVGFANTWFVSGFATRAARDAYVADSDGMAARAITRRELRKYAERDTIPHGFDAGRSAMVVRIGDAGECQYIAG